MYCIQLFRQTYKNIKPIKIFSAIQLKKVKKTRFETIRIELLPTPSSSLVFFRTFLTYCQFSSIENKRFWEVYGSRKAIFGHKSCTHTIFLPKMKIKMLEEKRNMEALHRNHYFQ